ncbi:MAG TPA: electron transfer flavoprotein subunit beta/FixA family protein [Thermomicrobiales bacterium]|nr:electron transfer flavoprotein subunit beta/FixA family protein [Thermomicrobiales bacterium]
MTIVVLVKQVPDLNAVRVDTATGAVRTSGKAVNSYDAYAVQHALNLKDALGAEVVAVTAGPANAKDALTRALAMGADRGVHIELDDQDQRDSLDMVNIFAEALKPLEPSVVLCGQQSDDIGTGQVGPQLAELLGMPHVSSVMAVGAEGDTITVQRDTEEGYQRVTAPMPVLLASGSITEDPINPSLKGMMVAKRKTVDKVTAAGRSGTTRLSWSEPKAPQREAEGIIVEGETAQDAAKQLVAWMKENKLVAS